MRIRPVAAERKLSRRLFEQLAEQIRSGRFAPGARLPTEQALTRSAGVSRTVVREAVAALRADGLVVTRQGVGAFVAENVRRPFRIDFDESSSLREVLNVMELRTGMEIEAAGLAADRASAGGIKKVSDCYDAIDAAIERGEMAVDQDFAFHCAIADATGNPQFRRFLEYLGRFIIPRQTIWGRSAPVLSRTHLNIFQKEHRQIVHAIRSKAVTKARAAMREHLLNSRRRHQKLADDLGVK
jgi:DNA-binding FadR family transcriptional regulator